MLFTEKINKLKAEKEALHNRLKKIEEEVDRLHSLDAKIGGSFVLMAELIEQDKSMVPVLRELFTEHLPELGFDSVVQPGVDPAVAEPITATHTTPKDEISKEITATETEEAAPSIADVEAGDICQVLSEPSNPPGKQKDGVGKIGTVSHISDNFPNTPVVLQLPSGIGYYRFEDLKKISSAPVPPPNQAELKLEAKAETPPTPVPVTDDNGRISEKVSEDDLIYSNDTGATISLPAPKTQEPVEVALIGFKLKTKDNGANAWADFLAENHGITCEIETSKETQTNPFNSTVRYLLWLYKESGLPKEVFFYNYATDATKAGESVPTPKPQKSEPKTESKVKIDETKNPPLEVAAPPTEKTHVGTLRVGQIVQIDDPTAPWHGCKGEILSNAEYDKQEKIDYYKVEVFFDDDNKTDFQLPEYVLKLEEKQNEANPAQLDDIEF